MLALCFRNKNSFIEVIGVQAISPKIQTLAFEDTLVILTFQAKMFSLFKIH